MESEEEEEAEEAEEEAEEEEAEGETRRMMVNVTKRRSLLNPSIFSRRIQ